MKCLIFTIILSILGSICVIGQSSDHNYILSRSYKVKGGKITDTDATKYWGDPNQVQTQLSYMDGLGKTSQTVSVSANPAYKDIVSQVGYNDMYQPDKQYLPVAVSTANGSYVAGASGRFYNNKNANNTDVDNVGYPTENFWTETIYDKSPLGRVSEQKAPGVSTGVRKKYLTNRTSEHGNIKWYQFNATDVLEESDNYPENSLSVSEVKDENDKKVEEFVDHNGRVVLKRVAGQEYTYYVYDAKGYLRYVLQPEFQTGTAILSDKLSRFAFQYTYDEQGRMMTKRVPGQNTFSMTYYENDMLKYMVDGGEKRFYYKYDNLNRQTEMGTGLIDGSEKPLVKTRYDDYSGISNSFNNELNLTDDDHFLGNPLTDPKKGLVTMTSARVLDGEDGYGDSWLNTVMFYDKKGRLIQIQRQLYGLSGTAIEQISYKLNFTGSIVLERNHQNTGSIEYQIDKVFMYDQQNRLLTTTHTFYEDDVVKKTYTHHTNTYDEVGQLATKKLHDQMQELEFKFTPRGWLFKLRNKEGKRFLVDLGYTSNGNINNLSWQTQAYSGNFNSISYDGSNRLSAANGSPYQENGITYDKNGNIKTLNRTGAAVDNLTYNYTIPNTTSTSNRLLSVTDGSSNATGVKDGTSNFTYDGNGNMTLDGSKNAVITYNLLNLPRQVTISGSANTVQYIYEGTGTKLQMTAPGANTLYAGAFEYSSDGTLLRVGLEEGQLVRNGSGNYEVNYYLRDHLGNVRMVLKEDGTVLQETEYYAFGLPVSKTGNDAANKYLYNGKEKQPETGWLDYGARMYMAEIGRFFTVDRFGEQYYSLSPYQYAANSPLMNVDVNGDSINIADLLASKDHAAAFIQFAGTKEGTAFLNKFAAKGQKVMSSDGKSIVYQAKADGKYHSDGSNLVYSISNTTKSSSTRWTYGNSTGGINVNVQIGKEGFGTSNKIFNLTEAIVHESLIHAIVDGSDFSDDRAMNLSTTPAIYRQYRENADHFKVSQDFYKNPNNNNSAFPAQAYRILQQTNTNLKLGFSNRQIRDALWNFEGSLIKFDNTGGIILRK